MVKSSISKKVKIAEFFSLIYLQIETYAYICIRLQQVSDLLNYQAGVVELVDTLDLGSSALRCESSSLSARTESSSEIESFFCFGKKTGKTTRKRRDEKFILSAVKGSLSARNE